MFYCSFFFGFFEDLMHISMQTHGVPVLLGPILVHVRIGMGLAPEIKNLGIHTIRQIFAS